MHKRLTAGATFLALTAALGAAGCGKKTASSDSTAIPATPATPVTVTAALRETVIRAVPVNGNVTALQSVSLSAKETAPVISVSGREGDAVAKGQIVIQQDTSDLQQQLEQDLANLQSAQAKLTQASTNYTLQLTTSATSVQNAKSQLGAAQSNLELAQKPQRSEEVRQAQIAVEQAKANYDKAVVDRKRYEILVKEGAEAQASLDQYQTTEQVQKANLDNAQQSLIIAQTGGRQESIRASQESVRQSQIGLQQAQANVAQNLAKLDDVHAAKATVAQSQAAVDLARKQIADASIRSPIDGVIATRSTEPGQQAAPGTTIMTIVALDTVYFQAQVPETDIAVMSPGKIVDVHADAFPGQTFHGQVSVVFPTASTSSRAFDVRVDVPNAAHMLRPGMFARGQVIVQKRQGIVVPKDAIVAANGDGTAFQLFVADGSKAVQRPVKIGIQTDTTSEILSGVQAGEQVIVSGQDGLKDGTAITVVKGDSAGSSTPQTASAK